MSDAREPTARRGVILRSLWALVEQVLSSVANFGIAVVVARHVPTVDHGRFALAFSTTVLAVDIHRAWVTQPLLMLTQHDVTADEQAEARGAVLFVHAKITAALMLFGAAAAAVVFTFDPALGRALLGGVAVVPCMLSLMLARRFCLARGVPFGAAVGAGVYLLAAAIALMVVGAHLDPFTALLVVACAALVATLACLPWIGRIRRPSAERRKTADSAHSSIGIFGLASAAARWVPEGAGYVLLPLLRPAEGLAMAGALKAAMTLLAPATRLNAALAMAAIPELRRRQDGRLARQFVLVSTAIGAVWGIVLVLFGESLLVLAFGERGADWTYVLYWLAPVPALHGAALVLGAIELANLRPRGELVLYAATAITYLVVLVAGAPAFGVPAAATAMSVGFVAAALAWWVLRMMRRREGSASRG